MGAGVKDICVVAAATLSLGLAAASPANAGFKNNYSQWREADRYGQYMYVQGLFDAVTGFAATDDAPWVKAKRNGVIECATGLGLDAAMIAEALTKHYVDHVDDWSYPPVLVFDVVVQSICLNQINSERLRLGLAPWTQRSGSINSALR